MKKSLLLGVACGFGMASFTNAQNYITNPKVINAPASLNQATPFLKKVMTGQESNTGLEKSVMGPSVNPYTNQPPVQFGVETIIGISTYDLQSNSSVQDRVMNNGDGTISAVWTYSESYDVAAADRGTGYNYFDGSAWGPQPTARIELEKTGWPSIGRTSTGTELFLCHNIAQAQLTQGMRSTIGTGAWSLSNVSSTDQVWNRMAIAGANGQTVHHVSLSDPFGGPIGGIQSPMWYWRSQDGGVTYDIQGGTIPGLDITNFNAFSGDSYNIAAKGDTVVVVYFGDLSRTVMAKSTDNGSTWTSTIIIDVFPTGVTYDAGSSNTTGSVIGISDVTGDGIADTVTATDGAGWVLLDHNGMAHVFFGAMDYLDDVEGDDQWSYFPGTNGLLYWNENFGDRDPVYIGGSMDIDGSGVLDIIGIAQYYQSLSTFPCAGIDASGCIYVSYSAVMENMDQGSQNYRHIYITKSCDGGCSWVDPVDVTPGSGFEENVYASMAHDVDANINIVWQRDFEPGIAVNGDEDPFVSNEIVHSAIPVTDINTSAVVCIGWIDGDSLFCAGDSVLLSATCGTAWSWSNGATTQSTYYKGSFGPVTVDITTPCGLVQGMINVAAPSSAPVITVSSTDYEMCDGEQATLTVSSSAGGIIAWSTGESTATITVDSVGTYTVSVTNCGGISIDSVVISLPSNPVFTITATKSVMCSGDSAVITASQVAQATIVWSTGDSTWTIGVNDTGTYIATVTNCGGVSIDSVVISLPSNPVFTITATQTVMCSGDTSVITASQVSQGTIVWSTGDSTWTIGVNDTGTYVATVTDCGGTSKDSITITLPAPPVAAITGTALFCNGESVVLTAASEPSASYLWSTGDATQSITVSTAGTFDVTVTNCGGSDNSSFTTSYFAAPTILVTSGNKNFCEDIGNAYVTLSAYASGASPFIYVWSNGDTIKDLTLEASSESGIYTVTAFDTCGSSVVAPADTVTINESPSLNTVSVTDASVFGANDGAITTVTTGGASPYIYQWSPSGGTNADATGLTSGTYSCVVTDSNGCTGSVSAFVDQPVGIDEVNIGTFSVHPNPNNGKFTVNLRGLYDEAYSFEIRNIIGQLIYAETFNGRSVSTVTMNLSEKNKGVYFLTISNADGKITEKLIVH